MGSDTITATIGGRLVTSAATVSVVSVPFSLSQSTIAVSPSNPIPSGGMATVTLTARDANGNLLSGGGLSVMFGLGGGNAQGTFGPVIEMRNGTYTATFTAIVAGTNTITATIAGQAVTSTPPTVTVVPGAVNLSKSTIALLPSTIASGKTATVTVTARDANGNQESGGGLTVKLGLGGGTARGTFGPVTDNRNGTYTATFTATVAGTNAITATIGGQAVSSTPPRVTVTAASPKSTSLGEASTNGLAVDAAPARVVVGRYDRDGQAAAVAGALIGGGYHERHAEAQSEHTDWRGQSGNKSVALQGRAAKF